MQQPGFSSLQLGPRVLRTETAPLAAIAILQARWGDMGRATTGLGRCPRLPLTPPPIAAASAHGSTREMAHRIDGVISSHRWKISACCAPGNSAYATGWLATDCKAEANTRLFPAGESWLPWMTNMGGASAEIWLMGDAASHSGLFSCKVHCIRSANHFSIDISGRISGGRQSRRHRKKAPRPAMRYPPAQNPGCHSSGDWV